jgi:hypothetical protein
LPERGSATPVLVVVDADRPARAVIIATGVTYRRLLAKFARRVTLLVRGQSLAAGMSDYLVKQLEETPKVMCG